MSYKLISIPEELYKKLATLKSGKESFASVIGRLISKEKPELKEFFGAWKDMDKDEEKKFLKQLKKVWSSKYEMPRL